MEPGIVLLLLLLLACPLMMVFMHRGGHGDHPSHGPDHNHTHGAAGETRSLDELRRTRTELDAEIARLEQAETETKTETKTETPAAVGGS